MAGSGMAGLGQHGRSHSVGNHDYLTIDVFVNSHTGT